jgi:hypothetical protein
MAKLEGRKFPTWHEIDPATRVKLLREQAAAFNPGDGPAVPPEHVAFQRACLYPIKQVMKETGMPEMVL